MDILNERPEGMSYLDYKAQLTFQKLWIKWKKQGQFYYVATDIFYTPEDKNQLFGLRSSYGPFKGKTKTDLLYPI